METLRREALAHFALAAGALALVTLAYDGSAPLALGLFGVVGLVAWRALPAHRHAAFGPANGLTVARAAITAALAGLLLAETIPAAAAAAAGAGALLLDGLDGRLARRTGLASPFGARFDMEVDALLVLVLAALVYHTGQAGLWVLGLGGLRYFWVGAGLVWAPLERELPPSRRRRGVCAGAVAMLLAALVLPAGVAAPLCAAALAALIYSFAVDLAWVLRAALRSGS
jgi:phosphatidylglycerophosphate synthase